MPLMPLAEAEVVGLMAGTLTTLAFVPQVLKAWRTRSVTDLSLGTFTMFASGVFLWLIYGLAIGSLSIILANVVTFVLAMALVLMKLFFKAPAAEPVAPSGAP